MRRQIEGLEKREREQNGKLNTREKQLLETLRSDIGAFEKNAAGASTTANDASGGGGSAAVVNGSTYRPKSRYIRRSGGRGKLSIYWDPILK